MNYGGAHEQCAVCRKPRTSREDECLFNSIELPGFGLGQTMLGNFRLTNDSKRPKTAGEMKRETQKR